MPSKVFSAAIIGLDAQIIEVEVDLYGGLRSFNIVGLPDKAVEESKERISSALKNSGAKPAHKHARRITVNLAPADLKKEGSLYDLPIAMGFLLASEQVKKFPTEDKIFIGELSLDGRLRSVNGVLAITLMAKEKGIKEIFLPRINAEEAALVDGITIFGINNLKELINHLENRKVLGHFTGSKEYPSEEPNFELDMRYIKSQEHAKRALEIAAAGGHNVLMSGPPGGGKTLLAKALATILPKMSWEEIIEVTKIYSIAGLLPKNRPIITIRPFRNPHHTASESALIGGGSWPRPGEISLSHRGVLFLDEFPEIHRDVLESLRQPIEDGFITVSRAKGTLTYPARFTLIAAHNPCPCGYINDHQKDCLCTPSQIASYRRKISGPIIDRIDIHLEVPRVKYEKLISESEEEPSSQIRERVGKARDIQAQRFKEENIYTNSEMHIPLIKKYCKVDTRSQDLLRNAVNRLHLSARSYHKILKLSRTIADLENSQDIQPKHVAEAIQYRERDEM